MKLYAVAGSVLKHRKLIVRGRYTDKVEAPVAVSCCWAETKADAQAVALALLHDEYPAAQGYQGHLAAVTLIPEARLCEWAERSGWSSPEEAQALRARVARREGRRSERERWEEAE